MNHKSACLLASSFQQWRRVVIKESNHATVLSGRLLSQLASVGSPAHTLHLRDNCPASPWRLTAAKSRHVLLLLIFLPVGESLFEAAARHSQSRSFSSVVTVIVGSFASRRSSRRVSFNEGFQFSSGFTDLAASGARLAEYMDRQNTGTRGFVAVVRRQGAPTYIGSPPLRHPWSCC